MKNKLTYVLIFILSHVLHGINAQSATSVIAVGGVVITGFGDDSTMVASTASNIASAHAIKKYIQDSVKANMGTITSVTAGAGLSGGVITTSGTISMPNTGTPDTYDKVTTDAQGRITSGYNPTIYDSVIRSLNTAYLISAKESFLCYSIKIGVSISISLGTASSGRLTPQHKSPGGSYWINLPYVENAPTLSGLGILTVGLLQSTVLQFNCTIPAGDSVKFQTSTTGTAGNVTFTLLYGQDKY